MLPNTITVSYGASDNLVLSKIREGNFSSEFSGIVNTSLEKVRLFINHTLPDRGKSGESHLVKLTVENLDAEGKYVSTTQSHTVFKTLDGLQNLAVSTLAQEVMTEVVTNVIDAVLNGES